MSQPWIKMRSNLWDDPRVSGLADRLEVGEAAVIGALYWLWSASDQHSTDGHLPGLKLSSLDRKTGLPGFGAALVEVGWLVVTEDGLQIPNFDEHNSKSAKKRALTARRVGSSRSTETNNCNAVSVTEASSNAENVTQPALQNECNATSVTDSSQNARNVTQSALHERYKSATPALARERERERERIKEPPPPSIIDSMPEPTPRSEEEEDFEELKKELLRLGVDQPGCLQVARRSGLSRSQIRELLAYFGDHAQACGWSPGALYQRLVTALPGLPVERGWPASKAPPPTAVSPAADADAVRAWWEQLGDDERTAICRSSPTLLKLAQILDWHPQRIRQQMPGSALPLLKERWRAAQDGTARPSSVPPQASPSAPQPSTAKAEEQAQKARETEAYQALEREYGPSLDALDRQSQLALADEVGWQHKRRVQERGAVGRSVRGPLLRRLQIQSGGNE